jgi:hypothetical protein
VIGDRETPRTDLGAIWFGHGVDLAERMNTLAAELAAEIPAPHGDRVAEAIREVLFDPQPASPPLGLPPTLRPAAPGWRPEPRRAKSEPGS